MYRDINQERMSLATNPLARIGIFTRQLRVLDEIRIVGIEPGPSMRAPCG
jgi:hypothetical protein